MPSNDSCLQNRPFKTTGASPIFRLTKHLEWPSIFPNRRLPFLDGKAKSLFTAMLLFVLAISMQANAKDYHGRGGFDQDVTGRVTNEKGEPVLGATVQVKGTNTATTTDIEGRFRISVPAADNAILVISFVGYDTQEVAVSGRTSVTGFHYKSQRQYERSGGNCVGYSPPDKRPGLRYRKCKAGRANR
jgi:hypothetical protein